MNISSSRLAQRALRLVLCSLLFTTTLGAQDAPGDFGPYHDRNMQLRLATGDTLVVYRVKYWSFDDGSAPALQIEYESPVSVDDTAAAFQQAIRIWPAFAPYVEKLDLSKAIITATNLTKKGGPGHWLTSFKHYGLIAERDGNGDWRIRRREGILPPGEKSAKPRIFEASGVPFSVDADSEKR